MINMGIINKYFEFKKKSLLEYVSIFFDGKEAYKKYLSDYIDTYINTYYFHITDTYYEEEPTVFDDKIIMKEIKAKHLEHLDDASRIEEEQYKEVAIKIIKECYKYSFIAIIMDFINYTYCDKLNDYKILLKETLVINKKLITDDDEIIEKLSVLAKESVSKERKFFVGLRNDTFNINYYAYRNNNRNYLVELEYKIEQLQRNYSKNILNKNYKNEKLSLDKFITTVNLLEIDLLNKISRNKIIKNYFVECPITSMKKEELEELVMRFNNPRIKDNVVFIVNYNDYTSNKSMFKNLKEFKFALIIDLSRTIVIDKKLAEIEGYDIFSYVIINGLKKEDHQLVENYIIPGKEMFMNELNMM